MPGFESDMQIKIDKDGVWISQAVKKNDGFIFCKWGGVVIYPTLTQNCEEAECKVVDRYARQ